jgi:hypothetical protein
MEMPPFLRVIIEVEWGSRSEDVPRYELPFITSNRFGAPTPSLAAGEKGENS